jgi:hypothetical protein
MLKYKVHENPSSGSGVDPCGWTGTNGDMIKLIVAIRNFANAHTNTLIYVLYVLCAYFICELNRRFASKSSVLGRYVSSGKCLLMNT